MKLVATIVLLTFFTGALRAQNENDTLPFNMFKNNVVLFADVGFNSAPFSIKNDYLLGVEKLKYRNNVKAALGIGIAYKWFGLRIGFTLPGNLLAQSRYGDTRYFDAGLKFNIKQVFCSIDFRNYNGYVIKDAKRWNDSLTELTPNLIQPGISAASFSASAWWFKNHDFNMKAALGRVGHFTGPSKTWYFKSTLNFFGVGNSKGRLVPPELSDTTDRQLANTVGGFDIGFVPGYVYGNRINNWQFAVFGGLGGVIQSKFYIKDGVNRSFLGLAPRIDLRLMGGYSKPRYFLFLSSNFDVKSVKIQSLTYTQWFYNVKLIGGFRIPTKSAKRKDSQK